MLVVIAAAVGVGLVQTSIAEQQAADAAAQERADRRQAEHDEAVRKGETALAAGERRLEESEDYAAPADYKALEKEVELLKQALADDDRTSITAKAKQVTMRVREIGQRPIPYAFSYTCRDGAGNSYRYESWEASWGSTVITVCDAKLGRGDTWPDEAIAAAQAGGIELDRLYIYYGMCAEPDFGYYGNGQLPNLSESQAVEAAAVLLLCPNHPAAASVQEAISRAGEAAQRLAELEQRKKDGTAFGPGLHVIGQPVQPGTYVSEGNFEGCYWERTDAAGEIIDNNFATNAARIEVTIEPGDYSFTSQRCGTFLKVG
ncbi:hypothetical protein [Agromyces albus]|uniref:Uncharacterized protein n=1 Tax=Agromyces albus TaxID=205332 RepID=A0A4Q2L632_9MICO|nr:hypothetical protein [Agromyces albus]RXZ71872.1 hypothetical protein ESP51_07005 [Agromyces albus]